MGQTRSNQELNANHQPWAIEKTGTHCQAASVGQPVPSGQAACRSKQVKPNLQVHGQTTSVITPSKSTIGRHGSNQVKPKNERQPPASGSREAGESPQGDLNRAARPGCSGCLPVKAGKTKFTGSWSNHACYKSLQINGRPPWVKPGQTKK